MFGFRAEIQTIAFVYLSNLLRRVNDIMCITKALLQHLQIMNQFNFEIILRDRKLYKLKTFFSYKGFLCKYFFI